MRLEFHTDLKTNKQTKKQTNKQTKKQHASVLTMMVRAWNGTDIMKTGYKQTRAAGVSATWRDKPTASERLGKS